ncbi:MAG TPA: rhomboid family intramembrane serine protease [Polyangiaceae bacterium]|nr:rhomboid family intramembrane serine protease [Polyangiaceae bacterium]
MPAPSDSPPPASRESNPIPATPLELAGQALLDDATLRWRAEVSRPGVLGLRSGQERAALFDGFDDPERTRLELEHLRRHPRAPRYLVVLGEPALRERLESTAIDLAASSIWLHFSDGESSWENFSLRWREERIAEALRAAAAAAFARRTWSREEADAHARRIELDRMLTRADAGDLERYRGLLDARPRATIALIGLILCVFGLQALWGGVDLPPLLARMGSLIPERALGGEWWRFVACTFLHGGVLHVVLNTVVLWMLGRSLEPFIGMPRFLFIYFASGLAGSLASSGFVTNQSVGASGAIWGLLGAHAALAFYPRPLLPAGLIPLARRAAATNLVLNLVNSFNPHVDAAAHIGGGLMGALVLVSMAMLGGLSSHGRASPPPSRALRVATGAFAVLFVVGLGRGIVAGRPWQLDSAPELERVPLTGSPWSVAIPRGQASRPSGDDAAKEFGNLAHDPTLVDISWVPLSDAPADREPHDELTMILHQLASVPEGLEQLSPPSIVRDPVSPARSHVAVRYRYASNAEVVNDRVVGVIDGRLVRVDVIAWAALPRAFDGLAQRVLRSIEPSVASRASLAAPSRVFHSSVSSSPGAGGAE